MYVIFFVFFLAHTQPCWATRSIHRPIDPTIPTVTTHWIGNDESYSLKNSHYEEYPIFTVFNKDYLGQHQLPDGPIHYRTNPKKSVLGSELSMLIEHLLLEVQEKKRHYRDFHVLSSKNFNRGRACGLMILKWRKHPFIVKLFIETPQTFINSHCKGLDNMWFFPMGGGVNRHIAGLTRVRNAHAIQERIKQDPYWSTFIDTPRKWFWLPKNTPWIEVTGTNIGAKKTVQTLIPGTYAVIADAIESEKKLSLTNAGGYRHLTMSLCNYLQMRQDPHLDNFIIEKNTKKLVIIDTENFATNVGFKQNIQFPSYYSWYRTLANKCMKDWFFRTKQDRLYAQHHKNEFAMKQLGLLG
jgi:hypothetical protein